MSINGIPNIGSSINSFQSASLKTNEVPQDQSKGSQFFSVMKERTLEGIENDQEFAYLLITQNGYINEGDKIQSAEQAMDILNSSSNTYITGAQSDSVPGYLSIV